MNNTYKKFQDLYEKEKSAEVKKNEKIFDKICEEFKKAELLSPPSASLLVKKGISILLSSEKCPYSLEDAEKAFIRAFKEDEKCFDAYVELAYYYLNVQNDAKKAKLYFEKALVIALETACESVCGIALCMSEIETPEVALKYLSNNKRLPLNDLRINKTIDEIRG